MSNTGREQLAQAMRKERARQAISQETLAERAGLHRTYISQIERSTRNVGVDNIEQIATALNLSISALFREGAVA